ncbi:hypothetical protein KGM_214378 [Danaus plexippus plexippus]|uniref:Uncharacterized protein n=1 Tax=Danaus plexippus plexippus TaxID=278856 RepID=A0A212FA87_DANPL|nr:hypothetical protein KGM_214378 [Danaus plexippus plexippus]
MKFLVVFFAVVAVAVANKPEVDSPIDVGPVIIDEDSPIDVGPVIIDEDSPIDVGPVIIDEDSPIDVGPVIIDEYPPIDVGPVIIDEKPVPSSPLVQIIINVKSAPSPVRPPFNPDDIRPEDVINVDPVIIEPDNAQVLPDQLN